MATPARVKKTTPSTPSTNGSKVIDLDAYVTRESGYDPETAAAAVTWGRAKLFGLEFRIQTGGMNVFNAMTIGDGEDTAATTKAMLRIIHPDDQAAFKNHVSVFAGTPTIRAFKKELAKHDTSGSTVRFPLDRPVPAALIRKLTAHRVKDSLEKDGKWRTKP